jgi:hypothetical protein
MSHGSHAAECQELPGRKRAHFIYAISRSSIQCKGSLGSISTSVNSNVAFTGASIPGHQVVRIAGFHAVMRSLVFMNIIYGF